MSLNTILATTPLTSTNYVLKATGTTIGNSLIFDNGTNVGIGNQGTTYKLDVSGTGNFSDVLRVSAATGFAVGSIAGYRRIEYTGTTFSMLTNADGYAALNAGAATFNATATTFSGTVQSVLISSSTADAAFTINAATSSYAYQTFAQNGVAKFEVGIDNITSNFYISKTPQTGSANANLIINKSSGISIFGYTTGVGTNFSPPVQVKTGAGVGNGYGIISANNEMTGGIQLSSSGTNSLQITADPDNLRGSSEIGFAIDGSQKMVLLSNGQLNINTSSSSPIQCTSTTNQYLTISSLTTYEAMLLCYNPNAGSWYTGIRDTAGLSSSTGFHIYSSGGGGDRLGIYQNGNYAFAGSNVSDVRLKENIQTININAIDSILQLVPKTYIMTNNPNVKRTGFIAQEVQQILPDLINGIEGEDEFLGLDYNGLLAISIKAIQELSAKNEELSNRLIKLESK
jgi:hypothetical protein